MKKVILIATLFLVSCSCDNMARFLDGRDGQYDGKATVEDYKNGYDYEIVAIDGKPVYRAKWGFIITRVPNVIVQPGKHIFSVKERTAGYKHKENDIDQVVNISAKVEAGRVYFFRKQNNRYSLVKVKSKK